MSNQTKPNRFKLWKFSELAARPPQPVLIPNAIRRGDHVVVAGSREFATGLRQALGQDTCLITVAENPSPAQRWEPLACADEIRQAGDGPAVIVHIASAAGALFDWYQQFPDAVFVANAPDRAEVVKLRNHADQGLELLIRDGVARLVRA